MMKIEQQQARGKRRQTQWGVMYSPQLTYLHGIQFGKLLDVRSKSKHAIDIELWLLTIQRLFVQKYAK